MTCFKNSLKDWRWFLLGVLLYVGVGMLPAVRLGAVDDLDWFEFRP
jgi:hypothetical protein